MSDLGDRYYVARWSTRWAVFDLADDSRHSTHPDEFDAIISCAQANANVRARRARGAA